MIKMQNGSIAITNPFELTSAQIGRLTKLGIDAPTNTIDEAVKVLVGKLRSEIEDISDVYTLTELFEMYEAVYGTIQVKPIITQDEPKPIVKVDIGGTVPKPRKKVRIDLTKDSSYAIPLYEHLSIYSDLEVREIKTGLAVKFVNGSFKTNVINYNELRTIYGVLHGNLYFNMIKSDTQYEQLGFDREYDWFRSFVVIRNINIADVIECLTKKNVDFLISLNTVANKRKIYNKDKLLQTAMSHTDSMPLVNVHYKNRNI